MKNAPDRASALDLLREHLASVSPGPLSEVDVDTVGQLLAEWRDTEGERSANGAVRIRTSAGWRGGRRAEWRPPVLTWEIAEHGHYYAYPERWTIDLENGRVRTSACDRRLLEEPTIQHPFDTAALAEELAPLIVDREEDERLEWSKTGRVRVPATRVFPRACSQTTQRRRDRLRRDLKERLAPHGWHPRPMGWWEYTGKPQDPPAWYHELYVCAECGDLSGRITHPKERALAYQSCRCRHEGPNMWKAHGIMFSGLLCRCCGQVLLTSESKFSGWFCSGCCSQVRWLNARLGRYTVPTGGHSIHGGFLLRGDATDVDVEIFVDRWNHITDAMTLVHEWGREVVRRVIAERLPDAPRRVPIESYLEACRDQEDEKMRTFRAMMEYLEQRAASLDRGGHDG